MVIFIICNLDFLLKLSQFKHWEPIVHPVVVLFYKHLGLRVPISTFQVQTVQQGYLTFLNLGTEMLDGLVKVQELGDEDSRLQIADVQAVYTRVLLGFGDVELAWVEERGDHDGRSFEICFYHLVPETGLRNEV